MGNGLDLFGSDFGAIESGDIFGDIGGGDILGAGGAFDIAGAPGILGAATSALYGGSIVPVARPSVPAPGGDFPGIMRGLGRGIASRFPLLWGAIQVWRGRGVSMTAEKLWGLVRRFGPQLLITAGGLEAGARSDLPLWRTSRHPRPVKVLKPTTVARATPPRLGF